MALSRRTASLACPLPVAPPPLSVGSRQRTSMVTGHPDLLVADFPNNKVYTYLNNGSGSFTVVGSGTTVGAGPDFISVADFNGDGKLDMAVQNNAASTVTVYLGNGDGTFKAASSTLTAGTNPYYLGNRRLQQGRPSRYRQHERRHYQQHRQYLPQHRCRLHRHRNRSQSHRHRHPHRGSQLPRRHLQRWEHLRAPPASPAPLPRQ